MPGLESKSPHTKNNQFTIPHARAAPDRPAAYRHARRLIDTAVTAPRQRPAPYTSSRSAFSMHKRLGANELLVLVLHLTLVLALHLACISVLARTSYWYGTRLLTSEAALTLVLALHLACISVLARTSYWYGTRHRRLHRTSLLLAVAADSRPFRV